MIQDTMRIELTEQQRRVVEEQRGGPVEVLDPSTERAYVLIAREQYEQVRSLLQAGPAPTASAARAGEIPPGMRRSMDAFSRDLARAALFREATRQMGLLPHGRGRRDRCERGRLIRECLRRGLHNDEYYTDVIEPRHAGPVGGRGDRAATVALRGSR